jgi:LPXTG-motif cell wall-anchored protein
VQAKPGAEIGLSGPITVTVTGTYRADGVPASEINLVATPKITIAEDVDLAVSVAKAPVAGERGKPVAAPIEVTNTGAKPVNGAAIRVVGYNGLHPIVDFRNCGYPRGDQEVYCRFDEELAAGATYVLAEPILAVAADAPGERDSGYVVQLWTGDDADESGLLSGMPRGTSRVLHLVGKPAASGMRALTTDSNRANNFAFGSIQLPELPGGTAAPSVSPATDITPNPSTGAGGELPVTGAQVAVTAGGGAGLTLLGGVVLVFARRRRARFIA